MTCTMRFPTFGGQSMAQSVEPVDMAIRLCLSQSCHLLSVSTLKPLRPCIRTPLSEQVSQSRLTFTPLTPKMSVSLTEMVKDGVNAKSKCVVFADSKGLSLTAVRVFSEMEDCPPMREPLSPLQELGGMTEGGYSCTVITSGQGSRLHLGFPQPSADFQSFRARLQEGKVLLENCIVTTLSLRGTVRVKNVSFQKAVHIRITFDSWRRYCDVPCTFLQQRYSGPETDIFQFDITLPKSLNVEERIEFCVSYLPDGYTTPFWDNNNGQNYSIFVCDKPVTISGRPLPTILQNRSL